MFASLKYKDQSRFEFVVPTVIINKVNKDAS